ncbi:hypothetical protein BJ170DRAFT_609542 [Xylariales sp. AK1849]|nr:hypothetical protein BJ170DRAFT_609542 [Xylariales sp. AK1849]
MSRLTPQRSRQARVGDTGDSPRPSASLLPRLDHVRYGQDARRSTTAGAAPVSPLSETQDIPLLQQQGATADRGDSRRLSHYSGHPNGPREASHSRSQDQVTSESSSAKPLGKRSRLRSHNDVPISWWWWWEITATILSIACMCALIVLLTKIDNIPLQDWLLQIQPNSVISVLTTIGKAALMVPAASCISQLKWRHFLLKPRKLVDLQLFDEASRGPWGSAVLIWRMCLSPKVLVALGFAFVTIIAMGIDVTAQQVLDFPLQETQLDNITIEMGNANQYFSKGFMEDPTYDGFIWMPNSDLLAVQSSIVNGATGTVSPPYFSCPEPASQCTWDTFTTLGVCADFKDVTDIITPKCSRIRGTYAINCTYTFPGMPEPDDPDSAITMHWDPENNGGDQHTTLFQSLFRTDDVAEWPSFGYFTAVKATGSGYPNVTSNGTMPPEVQVSFASLGWCAQTYRNVTASPSKITAGSITSERLTQVGSLVSPDDPSNTMGAHLLMYIANSTGASYNISRMASSSLPGYLRTLLTSIVYHDVLRPTNTDGQVLQLGFAYYKSDLSTLITNVAETMTNQIRSFSPGDNLNATTIQGRASFNETYIRVRWPWMILPLAETALAAFLLALSIFITDKQPLLKTSVIAYLTSKLDGWADDELGIVADSSKLTQEKLEYLAEGMRARLEEDADGRLRFRRHVKGA